MPSPLADRSSASVDLPPTERDANNATKKVFFVVDWGGLARPEVRANVKNSDNRRFSRPGFATRWTK